MDAGDQRPAGAPSVLLATLHNPLPRVNPRTRAASAGYAGAGSPVQEAAFRRGAPPPAAPGAPTAGLASHHPHVTAGSTPRSAPTSPEDDATAMYRRRMLQGTLVGAAEVAEAAETREFPRPMTASSSVAMASYAGNLGPSLLPSVGRDPPQPELLPSHDSGMFHCRGMHRAYRRTIYSCALCAAP